MNPLLQNQKSFFVDDEKIDKTKRNVFKHFDKVYVLCPMNSDVDLTNILDCSKIFEKSYLRNFIIYETKVNIISIDRFFNDMVIIDSNIINLGKPR